MSFGVSAGDFIAALGLIAKVVQALDDSRGAGEEYKELVSELNTLRNALKRIESLQVEDELQPQLAALRQAAGQCHTTIDRFWKHCMEDYETSLQSNKSCGTLTRFKDGCVKVKWAVLKSDDVARFKADIARHTESISMLLSFIHMCVHHRLYPRRSSCLMRQQ